MRVEPQRPLSISEWKQQTRIHQERVQVWTEPFRDRRVRRQTHPVYDFLFVYYRHSPAKLEQWHPGAGILLEASPEDAEAFGSPYAYDGHTLTLDPKTLDAKERKRLEFSLQLAQFVQARPAQFGCFGLHEWAMVYRADADGEVRHAESLPLRLTQSEINALVESRPLTCSHYDAYRFFTPGARPFNRLHPTKDTRIDLEQSGCLHTNMDLYRWASGAMPWLGSDFLWECFQLAINARKLDMQASPYDCRELGFAPIKIETPEGRSEYEQRQRAISEAAKPLRQQFIQKLSYLLTEA